MRNHGSLFALIALALTALFGCKPQQVAPVSPEQRLALIPTGEPLLTCRADCLAAWRGSELEAQALAARHRWADLALLVLRVNYDDDLTEYYLGEAAQGMGYRTAAPSYYRRSIALSGTSASCAANGGACGGISLPRAALARLAAVSRPAPRPRPPGAEKGGPKMEEPAAEPAVPQMEGTPLAPPSPVRAPSREEEQFIEPPPARP